MLTADVKENKKARMAFERAKKNETYYSTQLRKIARHIADIVKGFDPKDQQQAAQLVYVLEQYANTISPWARSVARRMVHEVARANEKAWKTYTEHLGSELKNQIKTAPVGNALRQLMDEQVHLITSIPRDAAKRVHELAIGALYTGERGGSIVDEIMKTGKVTRSRAELIARTEVGRATTTLTMVRAQHIGSKGYIWRSVEDSIVRPAIGTPHFTQLNTFTRGSHRKLNGTYHTWNNPPIAGQRGERAHPGSIYNCRCVAEPVLPD